MNENNATIERILKSEFRVTTNRDMHIESALKRIEKLVKWNVFHSCDAVDKLRGLPDEYKNKVIERMIYE